MYQSPPNLRRVVTASCDSCGHRGSGGFDKIICELFPVDKNGYCTYVGDMYVCDLYERGETLDERRSRFVREHEEANGQVQPIRT